MPKVDNWTKEWIRRAPDDPLVVWRLAAQLGLSRSCIKRIRNGSRGWPLQSGLGARPELLRTRKALEKWRTRQDAWTEAKYRRGLECIDRNEPVSITLTREEEMALMPGEPGSLGVFKGALAIKPRTPPPAPPAALRAHVPAKNQVGLFYDRR